MWQLTSSDFYSPGSEEVAADWREFGGGPPIAGALRDYAPEDVEGIAYRIVGGQGAGLVTWWREGSLAEIVSMHASPPGEGLGTVLLRVVEEELLTRGVNRVVLVTTNDNVNALSFYLKRGYRLTRIHENALDRVRSLKPGVPLVGLNGIALMDALELTKHLRPE
jgi:GNAT superfamily N-acetyltransferase